MCENYSLIRMFQEWWFTKDNRIKHHDVCLSLSEQQIGAPLLMRFCDSSENQVFTASLINIFLHDIYMKIKKCIFFCICSSVDTDGLVLKHLAY